MDLAAELAALDEPEGQAELPEGSSSPRADGSLLHGRSHSDGESDEHHLDAYPDTDAQYARQEEEDYPDTDAQYLQGRMSEYPNMDAQYAREQDSDGDEDAYPNTDEQYAEGSNPAVSPHTDGQSADGQEESYPDTDAQFAEMGGYPDTDAQYVETGRRESEWSKHVTRGVPPERSAEAAPASAREPSVAKAWRPPDWSKLPVMHQPKIVAYENGVMKRSMSLTRQRCYLLGRNGQHADIVLEHNSISRVHCAIINSSSATFVQDLGSFHGTFIDLEGRTTAVPKLGERLQGEQPVKLVEGSTLRLGNCRTVYQLIGLQPPQLERWHPPTWSEPPTHKISLEIRSNSFSNPYLAHLADEGADFDEEVPLTARASLFGRSGALVDIVVRDESISRQHAAIVHADKDSYLVDLGSASGSYVDGQRLKKDQTFKLYDGAIIRLGESKATYTVRIQKPSAASRGGAKRKR